VCDSGAFAAESKPRPWRGNRSQDICPAGGESECSVSDDDGGGCGGEVLYLEGYAEIDGEFYPAFTCREHEGYFL
jgi:hypothetical protein